MPPYVQGLWKEGVFLAFAAEYVPMNNIEAPVVITDKIYKDFEIFLEDYEIGYKLPFKYKFISSSYFLSPHIMKSLDGSKSMTYFNTGLRITLD